MKRFTVVICAVIALFSIFSLVTYAAPTDSFTRINEAGGELTTVSSREVFSPVQRISASSLGVEEALEGLTDVCCGNDGRVYLLCGDEGASRVIILTPDYKLEKELAVVDQQGDEVYFDGAQGIFVDRNNDIFICDTEHGRILVTDASGIVKEEWGSPVSSYIPEDFVYQPTRVTKDEKGYLYILSLGNYYGALSYSPEGDFLGFYGANTVEATILSTLSNLWERLTSNEEKKSQSSKKLPFSFIDFCVDEDGYVITCTGRTDNRDNGQGQIRKFCSEGSNILFKREPNGSATSSSSVNFLEKEVIVANAKTRTQNLIAVDTDPAGYIYALDQTYGLVYVYDQECNLVTGFGGGYESGDQLGTFNKVVALCRQGSSVLVADAGTYSVTVFEPTAFGKLLFNAQSLYIKGDYAETKELWHEVLSLDAGNQMAYKGLAMVYYGEGDYTKALTYAKAGLDYAVYDLVWQEVVSDFLAEYFVWIALGIVLIIAGCIVLLVCVKKKRVTLISHPKVKTYCGVIFHPFRSFEELKYKKQGSLFIAVFLIIALFAAVALNTSGSGFLFNRTTPDSYNVLYTLLETVGVILLWTLSNWLICSLFSGKGTLKEVFIASAYSVTPLIALSFLEFVLSQFLPLSSEGFLTGMGIIAWLYSLFLLCVAMITIHEYDFFKFLSTSLGVIFLMVVIVFLLFFVLIMLNMCKIFVFEVYEELFFR